MSSSSSSSRSSVTTGSSRDETASSRDETATTSTVETATSTVETATSRLETEHLTLSSSKTGSGVNDEPGSYSKSDTANSKTGNAINRNDVTRDAINRNDVTSANNTPPTLHMVHRLDKETTGVQIFAKFVILYWINI